MPPCRGSTGGNWRRVGGSLKGADSSGELGTASTLEPLPWLPGSGAAWALGSVVSYNRSTPLPPASLLQHLTRNPQRRKRCQGVVVPAESWRLEYVVHCKNSSIGSRVVTGRRNGCCPQSLVSESMAAKHLRVCMLRFPVARWHPVAKALGRCPQSPPSQIAPLFWAKAPTQAVS